MIMDPTSIGLFCGLFFVCVFLGVIAILRIKEYFKEGDMVDLISGVAYGITANATTTATIIIILELTFKK